VNASIERLSRRTGPRIIVAASRLDGRAQLGARARRALGRRGRVELYFAFDDASSAFAMLDLAARTAGRDVRLLLRPVVARGIPDDPAVEDKRTYAIEDTRRLGRRLGLTLSRTVPIDPAEVAFLAQWVAGSPQGPALERFCVDAMRELWFSSPDGPVDHAVYRRLWQRATGGLPPAEVDDPVHANERAMAHRGPYDTPAAWVHGQWFFAQDRGAQIGERLDDLGWTVAA
jgi:2-hydroxychromene-2-carboxylate isomerase